MAKGKDIILRVLLENINKVLKENMEKPILKMGYSSYDTTNGRKVYSIRDVEKLANDIVENKFYFSGYANSVRLFGTPLVIKTRSKKSGLQYSYGTDSKTVVEVYVENTELLNKTIASIEKESEDKENQEAIALRNANIKALEDMIKAIEASGVSLEKFMELQYKYTGLDDKAKQYLHQTYRTKTNTLSIQKYM